jgi:hypothetical protein
MLDANQVISDITPWYQTKNSIFIEKYDFIAVHFYTYNDWNYSPDLNLMIPL